MYYKKRNEPVMNLPIHLMISTPEELGVWLAKRNVSVDKDDFLFSGGLTFDHVDANGSPLVWFPKPEEGSGIQLCAVVHETFHLWTFVKSQMVGSKNIELNIHNAEYDAYHFHQLAEMVFAFAMDGCNHTMQFPTAERHPKKAQIELEDKKADD